MIQQLKCAAVQSVPTMSCLDHPVCYKNVSARTVYMLITSSSHADLWDVKHVEQGDQKKTHYCQKNEDDLHTTRTFISLK